MLNISKKYEMEITFSILAFPKAAQRCPYPPPPPIHHSRMTLVWSPRLCLPSGSVSSMCWQTEAVSTKLLKVWFLYSSFSRSLPFPHYFFFLRSITNKDPETNHTHATCTHTRTHTQMPLSGM
jgi:hypothetical protein